VSDPVSEPVSDPQPPRAVVLMSGGLDSAVVTAMALREGLEVYGLTADYGQRHDLEVHRAVAQAINAQVAHRIITIDPAIFGVTNSLTGVSDDLGAPAEHARPSTYVPARNTVLLAQALAVAEVVSAEHIFIGCNDADASGYPDCRPEYLVAFEKLARLATWSTGKLRIRAPLLSMDKRAIIRTGVDLGVDFRLTSSCYRPDLMGHPCMACTACRLRADGFAANDMRDPVIPEAWYA
jgi:7-cyano-7-deazaguanine synthase